MAPRPQDLVTRSARLETLLEVSRQLSRIQPLESLLANMAEACGHLLDSDSVGIRVVDGDDLVLAAVYGDAQQAMPTPRIKIGESFTGIVVETGKALVVWDPANDPRLTPAHREAYRRGGYRAFLGVPLKLGEQVLGVLSIRTRREHGFSREDLAIVTAFAAQAATALENARLFRQTEGRAEKLKTLAALSRLMSSAQDSSQVCDAVARAATTLLGAATTRVWVSDPVGRVLRTQGSFWIDPKLDEVMTEFPTIPYGQGLVGGIVESRTPEFLLDIGKDPRWLNRRLATDGGLQSFAGVPLIVDSDIVGVLAILFHERRSFTSEERELMALLADQAAIAIRNARLLQALKTRQIHLETLLDVSRQLSTIQPVEALLATISEACGRLLGSESVGFRLVEGEELVLAGSWGDAKEVMVTSRLRIGESLSGRVAVSGEPLVVPDLVNDPRVIPAHRETIRRRGYRAFMAVPVKVGERVVGVLSIRTRRVEGFSAEAVRIATAFAAQAAVALENARLYSETEHRRSVAERLADIGRLISQSLESEIIGQKIVEGLRVLLGARASALYRLDPVSRDLQARSIAGEIGPLALLPAGTGLAGLAVREGEPVVTPNVATDPRVVLPPIGREQIDRELARAALAVPLRVQGTIVGVLTVGDREGRMFSDDDVRLAQAFADQAVLALENARLYEEARTHLKRMQTLLAIGQTVGTTLDLTETLRRVARETRQALGADMVGAYLADEDERLLHPIAGSGVPTHLAQAFRNFPFPLKGHRFVEDAWEHHQTVWSDDAEADPRIDREVFARFPHGSVAFVPMIAKDRPIGGLFLVWWTRRPALTPDELLLAEGISQQAAIAVGNARLYDEVHQTLEELRRTKEQLTQAQKMDAIGQLAGGIAHDFNNLLTVIIGRSQLVGRDPRAADSVRRGLEIIDKSAKMAADLTRQLLAFSRKQVLQPQVLDLTTVVSSTNEMLRRLIGEDIALVTVLAPALGRVNADPGQIEQILMNLAVNARDAMPAGGRLTIETANVELDAPYVGRHVGARPGPHIMLAVSDTGVGMSRETMVHVFEPFFTTKEVGKGTGLGLSTVYGIVKQSGGYIWVDSEPGAGATFKIYLPRVEDAAEPSAATTATPAEAPRGPETLLLVEDEGEVRALARDILQARGYTVLEAPDGAEGLRIGERHPGVIHLLLTDVVMPGMSGRELANRLIALRPGMAVLYMSGYTDNAAVHHGVLDSGATFLQKPMAPDALVRKVRELLDQRTLTAVNRT